MGTTSTTSTTTTIARPTIPDGITETVYRSVESYRLVMLLRDGNWRVELIERLAAKEPLVATDWNISTTKARVPVRISTTVEAITQEPSTTIEFNSARREWPR